jgi:hypothetical protein
MSDNKGTYTKEEVKMRAQIHANFFNEAVNQRDEAIARYEELAKAIQYWFRASLSNHKSIKILKANLIADDPETARVLIKVLGL